MNVLFAKTQFQVIIDSVDTCPVCKYGICVDERSRFTFRGNDRTLYIADLYVCPRCSQAFVAKYKCKGSENGNTLGRFETVLEYVAPNYHQEKTFDPEIEKLSPDFVKIYNQSAAAEAQGLTSIVGSGYRKSIEFLVKDYCIHKNPDKEDDIKGANLNSCIQTWIDDERTKTLASRAVWIGNDETHYVRLQPDLDVDDMKRFLRALLGFITSDLAYEEASGISSAK